MEYSNTQLELDETKSLIFLSGSNLFYTPLRTGLKKQEETESNLLFVGPVQSNPLLKIGPSKQYEVIFTVKYLFKRMTQSIKRFWFE